MEHDVDREGRVFAYCRKGPHGGPPCGYWYYQSRWEPTATQQEPPPPPPDVPQRPRLTLVPSRPVPSSAPARPRIDEPGRRCACGGEIRRKGNVYPYNTCWKCREQADRDGRRAMGRRRRQGHPQYRRLCACGRPLRVRGGQRYDQCYTCRMRASA